MPPFIVLLLLCHVIIPTRRDQVTCTRAFCSDNMGLQGLRNVNSVTIFPAVSVSNHIDIENYKWYLFLFFNIFLDALASLDLKLSVAQ